MSHTRLIAAALSVALLAGCTLPGRTDRDAGTGGPNAGTQAGWRSCEDIPRKLVGRAAANMAYDCRTVKVPRDWNHPDGQTFDVAMIRIRSANQGNRIGSVLMNPGGPGASGIDMAVYLSYGAAYGGLPDEIMQRFDLVGFDPRGIGRSSPVDCVSDADLDASFGFDPDPAGQTSFDNLVSLDKRIGQACKAKYGSQLGLYSTEQTARDLDALRAAVGDDKLTYLGFSYGTLLGATYAQLFPKKIRTMVLDGAVDPTQSSIASAESQAKGFELAFRNFAGWCRSNATRCPIAPDAQAAVRSAFQRARTAPVTGPDGRKATPGWVFYAVVYALYSKRNWEDLAKAMRDLVAGDAKAALKLADAYAERDAQGHYSNFFDANFAVNCADEGPDVSLGTVRQLQTQWRAKYPLFGTALATELLGCTAWPASRDPYPTGAAVGAPPILVVGTTGDPATPYEQTGKLAKMLGVGHVLTWEGEGHTAYPETPCITAAVDAYLISLKLPPAGQRCPAH